MPVPGWLLRNRKYTGLCFAVAMGWQGLFIFLMTNIHRGYYFEEIFFLPLFIIGLGTLLLTKVNNESGPAEVSPLHD